MVKVLKNPTSATVFTNSFGKIFTIKAKSSLKITDSQSEKIVQDLLYRYPFLKDITPQKKISVNTVDSVERNERGKRYLKTKKVVAKAKGVAL